MKKMNDDDFLIQTGMSYYRAKEYQRAVIIFSFLGGDWPKQGICYAGLGDKQRAFDVWEICSRVTEFDQIAIECRERSLVETGAEFFLSLAKKNPTYKQLFASGPGRFIYAGQDNKIPAVLALMDAYFEDNPDMEKMRAWGEYIAQHDHACSYVEHVLKHLEKTGQNNVLIAYFHKYKILIDEGYIEEVDFNNQLKELKAAASVSPEALAIRYLILEKTDELKQILPGIPLTRDNFCLYLWGDQDLRYKAYDYCTQNHLDELLLGTLISIREDSLLGEFYEYTGSLPLAAQHYEYARQYRKAAELYERAEKYRNAGDCYFGLKDYQTALVLYKKVHPANPVKIARTFERLKDYESAIIYWKQAGHTQAIHRCKKKIVQRDQKQQKKLPFPGT